MTETYYKVWREAPGVTSECKMEFRTLEDAAAYVDEMRELCPGWIFHIDEKTREKKPTFRF